MEFAFIERDVPRGVVGIYEIHLRGGVPLKVGIARDLRRRLRGHRASRDSGLKLRDGGSWDNPADVTSKSSILAKHLFFDQTLTSAYELRTQAGRRAFLAEQCYVTIEILPSLEEAVRRERLLEQSGRFRYVGRAKIR